MSVLLKYWLNIYFLSYVDLPLDKQKNVVDKREVHSNCFIQNMWYPHIVYKTT